MKTFTEYLQVRENNATQLGQRVMGLGTTVSEKQLKGLVALYRLVDEIWEPYHTSLMAHLRSYKGKNEKIDKLLEDVENDYASTLQGVKKTTGEFGRSDKSGVQEPEEIVPTVDGPGGAGVEEM